jgi:predicted DNA-binding transcriptional regulator YafY
MRADRLVSLMLLLQSKGRMTANELAERLEVSERTIYRDIEALSYAGVPVYTQSGVNGGVFLDENYRVTLTGLTRSQIQSLFVSVQAGPLQDLGLAGAVEETLLKLLAALPSMHRDEAERMRQRVHIDPVGWFQLVEPEPLLPLLQQAVWEDRRVEISYQRSDGEQYERVIDAYSLVAKGNIWYLIARRPDGVMRTYRVSRILAAALSDTHFERMPTFDLAAFWTHTSSAFERMALENDEPCHTRVRTSRIGLAFFASYMNGRFKQLDAPDHSGWATLEVIFDSFDQARTYSLGLGAHIRVIEPNSLHESVIETARAILDMHHPSG